MKKLLLVFTTMIMILVGCGTTEVKENTDQPKQEETKKNKSRFRSLKIMEKKR